MGTASGVFARLAQTSVTSRWTFAWRAWIMLVDVRPARGNRGLASVLDAANRAVRTKVASIVGIANECSGLNDARTSI